MNLHVLAPGRVNLIGDHTDYTGGLVLPMAIDRSESANLWSPLAMTVIGGVVSSTLLALDRYTEIRGTRTGDRVHLSSFDEPEPVDLPLHVERPHDTEPAWGKYVAGVISEMSDPHAFRGHVTTDIPIGAGLSSSAALEVAVALVLGFHGTPLALAQLCQRAENRASGVPSGIMDQLAIAAGVAGHALMIDCGELTVTPVALPRDVEIIVQFIAHRTLVAAPTPTGSPSARRPSEPSGRCATPPQHAPSRSPTLWCEHGRCTSPARTVG
ncbi:MAG: galactokinase family protein [Ilumatobacteraceae bacterium]